MSLHAIVGSGAGVGDNNNNNNNDLTESPKSTATTQKSSNEALSGTKTWQPPQQQRQQQRSNARHLEQATLYGQNSNSSKTRVGVACVDCDDCYAIVADADESQLRYHQYHLQPQQLRKQKQQDQESGVLSETTPPTRRRDLESFRLYGDAVTAASTLNAAEAAVFDNANADDLR